MSKYEPKTGTTGTCVHCGQPIEYVSGPPAVQWVHMPVRPGSAYFEVFCQTTRATPA